MSDQNTPPTPDSNSASSTPTPAPEPTNTNSATPAPAPAPSPAPQPAPEPLTLESLKLPEGRELDPDLGKSLVEVLNKDMTPAERATALVDLQAKAEEKLTERLVTQWEELQESWKEAARKDPEIGGANFDPTMGSISKMLSTYPRNTELKALLDSSGMGNHVEGMKFMKWVADRLNEGSNPAVGDPSGVSDPARRLYPTMPN